MQEQSPAPPDRPAESHARITDRRTVPPGVVPRHLQQWGLIGTAVVMVGILALSGSPTPTRPSATTSTAGTAVDPNQQRIEEYQRRIQEQTQRLAAEQAQLQLAKQAIAVGAEVSPMGASSVATGRPPASANAAVVRTPGEDRARVADNVAYSRPSPAPSAVVSGPVGLPTPSSSAAVVGFPPVAAPPALVQSTGVQGPVADVPVAGPGAPRRGGGASSGEAPRYRLFEGTIIETVLTNRLDGTYPGPVNALVSVPVYAADQQHLVIPAGSRVLGEARAVNTFGQSRLAVAFRRVILPTGVHVDLDGFHGLNQAGDLGLRDQVNRHYGQIFGVSLALGAIAGFAQAQSTVGLDATGLDTYRQGAAANVSQSSARILERFLNILPTVTIREGHRIKVYLSNDLDLPAYREPVPLPGGQP